MVDSLRDENEKKEYIKNNALIACLINRPISLIIGSTGNFLVGACDIQTWHSIGTLKIMNFRAMGASCK